MVGGLFDFKMAMSHSSFSFISLSRGTMSMFHDITNDHTAINSPYLTASVADYKIAVVVRSAVVEKRRQACFRLVLLTSKFVQDYSRSS